MTIRLQIIFARIVFAYLELIFKSVSLGTPGQNTAGDLLNTEVDNWKTEARDLEKELRT